MPPKAKAARPARSAKTSPSPASAPAGPAHDRRVAYLPLEELTGDPRNPKAHSADTIASSIDRFGFMEPIVRDDRTGFIVSGHGRAHALRERQVQGAPPPEGVTVSDDGEWLVPVTVGWSSRDDHEAAAALIALNRTVELGGWADESLLDLLNTLSANSSADADLFSGIGFTEDDRRALDALLHSYGDDDDGEEMTDEEFKDLVDGATSISLTIAGLTNNEVARFRELPGADDAARLRSLLDPAPLPDAPGRDADDDDEV